MLISFLAFAVFFFAFQLDFPNFIQSIPADISQNISCNVKLLNLM